MSNEWRGGIKNTHENESLSSSIFIMLSSMLEQPLYSVCVVTLQNIASLLFFLLLLLLRLLLVCLDCLMLCAYVSGKNTPRKHEIIHSSC